jgi:hypothetical protein
LAAERKDIFKDLLKNVEKQTGLAWKAFEKIENAEYGIIGMKNSAFKKLDRSLGVARNGINDHISEIICSPNDNMIKTISEYTTIHLISFLVFKIILFRTKISTP